MQTSCEEDLAITYYRTDEDQQEKPVLGYKQGGQTFENTRKKHTEHLPFASSPQPLTNAVSQLLSLEGTSGGHPDQPPVQRRPSSKSGQVVHC